MAIIKAVNSKASIGKAINYITKGEKTEERLISGKDCNPRTAIDEMKATKEQWGKTEGRQYAHLVQSFNPEDKVTPKQAHEIGRKFIESNEKFKGHEVVIATHVDKGHVHNHFIVNSVNFENGKKLHITKKELQQLKERSNELSREHGLSVPTRGDAITTFDQKKYRAIEKGAKGQDKSYLLDTARNVSQSLKKATSREEFIKDMESKGYKVNWKDTRKHITFTTPEGKKVRNSNLEKTFKEPKFSKEGIEDWIQHNRKIFIEYLERAEEEKRKKQYQKQVAPISSKSPPKSILNGADMGNIKPQEKNQIRVDLGAKTERQSVKERLKQIQQSKNSVSSVAQTRKDTKIRGIER